MDETRITESREMIGESLHAHEDVVAFPERSLGELYGELKANMESVGTALSSQSEAGEAASDLVITALQIEMLALSKNSLPATVDAAIGFALGVYTEEEGKKDDMWRDEAIYNPSENTDIYRHSSHEVTEIKRNINRQELDYLLHNTADMVGLAGILHAAIIERQ